MPKQTYRVRNWKEYNKSLVKQGSVSLWFSEARPIIKSYVKLTLSYPYRLIVFGARFASEQLLFDLGYSFNI